MSYNKKYSKYLHTPEWIAKRNKIREERKVCEICGNKDKLQVHHLNYDNLGNEKYEVRIAITNGLLTLEQVRDSEIEFIKEG